MSDSPPKFRPSKPEGVALIVVLGALVLITGMILVFFTQATLSRQIALSSAGQLKAKNIAHVGMETIIGDLRSEIVAGSDAKKVNGTTVFLPLTNSTVIPSSFLPPAYTNVVKISTRGTNAWTGTAYNPTPASPIRAIPVNTTDSSANARFIDANRWNTPYLLGTTLPLEFVPPDWCLVTRQGTLSDASSVPALSSLSESSPNNPDYVLGRFAYIIYNEGGLLDINVAGSPDSVDIAFRSKRGLLAQMDLTAIPGIADAGAFISWRNAATALSGQSYTDHIFNDSTGFTEVATGDQSFIGRQDLINYSKNNPGSIGLQALPYLGTFSRSLNAPSFTPSSSRPKVGSGMPAWNKDDLYNPSLINTRVTTPFTRYSDKSSAMTGDSLIKYRFPLKQLALFREPISADSNTSIAALFGLSRSSASSPWMYRGGATTIMTLGNVALEGREPDFFELLQAGIMVGSLGKGAAQSTAQLWSFDTNIANQVIQIGANIIDQYDADSWPTQIFFNGFEFTGIEDLPVTTQVAPWWHYH